MIFNRHANLNKYRRNFWARGYIVGRNKKVIKEKKSVGRR